MSLSVQLYLLAVGGDEARHQRAVRAPAHPLPENTSALPPGNLQLTLTPATHTHARGTSPGEPEKQFHKSLKPTESLPKKPHLHRVRPAGSAGSTEPTPPGWTNFSRASSPRSASWCQRERRCSKVRARVESLGVVESASVYRVSVQRCVIWRLFRSGA